MRSTPPETAERADPGAGEDLGEPTAPSPDDAGADLSAASDWRHPSVNALVAMGLVLIGLVIGLGALYDNSFMTHLATGRIILDEGAIPRVDPYSFTAPGRPWTVQSWGASVIFAGAEDLFGLTGIRILVALCTSSLALIVWRLTRPAGSLLARLVPAVIVVGIGASVWVERPLLFGLLCLGAVVAAGEGELDPRWLVPVMWIWVNVHGSFPLGLAALGLVMVGRWLDRERADVEVRALAWAGLGTALGALNPLGPKLLTFPLQLLSNRESFAGIAEWGPPSWQTPGEWFFVVELALAALVMVTRCRRWRVALPLVVFAVASLTSVRNMAPASLILLPGLVAGLRGVGSLDGTRRPRTAPLFAALLGALLVVVSVTSITTGVDTNLRDYPEEATTWMETNELLGVDERVVSRDFVGNYWEARFGPDDVRVYIDDRVDMYPLAVIEDYSTLVKAGDYQGVLDRADATAVLWDRDSDFGRWIARSQRWRVVHRDADWLVAVPR